MQQLRPGEPYYFLSFFDERLSIPQVETYIYLGDNLRGEDPGDRIRYFKDPDRFLLSKYSVELDDLEHCVLVGDDTSELILDLGGLIAGLEKIARA